MATPLEQYAPTSHNHFNGGVAAAPESPPLPRLDAPPALRRLQQSDYFSLSSPVGDRLADGVTAFQPNFLLLPPSVRHPSDEEVMMNPAAAAAYLVGTAAAAAAPFLYGSCALSYTREWQNKLRDLQCYRVATAPDVTYNPSKNPKSSPSVRQESLFKMDSNGALNLASSPKASSPSSSTAAAVTLVSSGDTRHVSTSGGGGRSPPNYTLAKNGASGSGNANFGVEICVVCGDRASGRHYGAISCEGCKGFFKRSIRKQLGYQCRGGRNCEVTKHHRNRCQYCRLQKCLAMGMRSDSVQTERRPNSGAGPAATADLGHYSLYDSPAMLPQTPIAQEVLMASASGDLEEDNSTENGSSNGDPFSSGLDPSAVLAARERSLISRAMDTVTKTLAAANATAADHGLESSGSDEEEESLEVEVLDSSLIKFQLATPSPMPSYLNVHFICETASRLLFLSIHWVRSIPAFAMLGYDSQVGLVRNAWSDLFVLGMAQCSQAMNLQNILAAIVSHLQTSVSQEKLTSQRVRQVTTTICKVQEYVRTMARMQIDDREFAYLKVIALFGTDQLGVPCPRQVERLKNKAVAELKKYCERQKSSSVRSVEESRFSDLLLRLAPLRSLQPDVLEELFFAGLIGNVQIDSVVPYILKMENSEYQSQFAGGSRGEMNEEEEEEEEDDSSSLTIVQGEA